MDLVAGDWHTFRQQPALHVTQLLVGFEHGGEVQQTKPSTFSRCAFQPERIGARAEHLQATADASLPP